MIVEDLDRMFKIRCRFLAMGWALCLAVSVFIWPFGFMMFDAPGSENKPVLRVAFDAYVSLPITLLLGLVLALVAARTGKRVVGRGALLLPLVHFLVVIGALSQWN